MHKSGIKNANMSNFKGPSLEALKTCLLDLTQPIGKRTTAAFYLRTIGTVDAAEVIGEALAARKDSSLMRHELAYILGQMQHRELCPTLSSILADEDDDVLVRHEAAEALGAIGDPNSLEILYKFGEHIAPEIKETCIIAIDLINWKRSEESKSVEKSRYYLSEDPAPPSLEPSSIAELQVKLMDSSSTLFHRYRAMFALRNLNSDAASLALCTGFCDKSALFRHEIAYVLGQMHRKITVPALSEVLINTSEHSMVRHEAAEALGAIGGEEVEQLLSGYQDDSEIVVRESCNVALDAMEYWSSAGDTFLEGFENEV
jgi:deoxyhypusine monooxygenase